MSPHPSTLDLPMTRGFVPALRRRRRGGRAGRAVVIGFVVPYLAGRFIGPWADPLLPLALGAALVTSVAMGRPLIAVFAARRAGRGGGPAVDIGSPRVQRVFARVTMVWGTVMLAEAGATAWLVAGHAAHLTTINTIASLAVPAALVPVTIAYVRRTVRALVSDR